MSTSPDLDPGSRRSIAALVAAFVVALFGFLPLINWIPGGYSDAFFGLQLDEWASGLAIAGGLGLVLAIVSLDRKWNRLVWRDGIATRAGALFARRPIAVSLGIALAALVLYLVVAVRLFDGRPLLIDEIAQVIQAQTFAAGRLWTPQAAHPEFWSTLHIVEQDGRVYSQFPPGGPAVLALGALVGAPWIVGPLCGALAVLVFAALVRRAEPRPAVALGALLLFAFAPMMVFMSGSHMNHVPTLLGVLLGAMALAAAMDSERPRPAMAFVSGLGFGIAATIRPVDALAWALPAGLWYLARALREPRRWADALASGAGVALPMLAMMWVNLHTTGGALTFGYTVLWGPGHDLGFHTAPWGLEHTPARGVELINLYFLRLQRFLLESPVPALLPVVGALLLVRRLSTHDRYLLAVSALLAVCYWAYWHDGFYMGPRFFYTLAPVLVLWIARFPALLRERWGTWRKGLAPRTALFAYAVSGLVSAAYATPMRARQYAASFVTEHWSQARAARAAGVHGALVFVRESWESQLVVRLWGLGISHADAERLYKSIDACQLEESIGALEGANVRGQAALTALLPLMANAAHVVTREVAGGTNVRMLPGLRYTPRCEARLAESAHGTMPLAPLMVREPGDDNIYVRDLHERDALLVARYPDRPVYLLYPDDPGARALPTFHAASRDSLLALGAAR